ncbi:hypothetical protein [Serratia aquatilis]|uniref:Uncharacterized protein n=1 Tax=Serratia aquatilis TaxID=1737515 RepID=A0ABV6EEK8_9GAMM
MGDEEKLLATLIGNDTFHNEEAKVSGIAQRAIDKGFSSLSAAQKKVLEPFMSHECDGYTDPGGFHHDCPNTLEGSELSEAYEEFSEHEAILCESCREEVNFQDYQREKFMRD